MSALQLVKGCALFYELFLILNGSAEVKKGDYIIAKLRRGDLFGEMVLLKDNVRKADIFVKNYANVLVINYDQIFGNFKSNRDIFGILMLNLSRMLATRLNKAGNKIEELIIENQDLKSDKKAA